MRGHGDKAVFVQHHIFRQNTVNRAAHSAGHGIAADPAADPALKEGANHPVTGLETRDAVAHFDHLARTIGIRRARHRNAAPGRVKNVQIIAVIDR